MEGGVAYIYIYIYVYISTVTQATISHPAKSSFSTPRLRRQYSAEMVSPSRPPPPPAPTPLWCGCGMCFVQVGFLGLRGLQPGEAKFKGEPGASDFAFRRTRPS